MRRCDFLNSPFYPHTYLERSGHFLVTSYALTLHDSSVESILLIFGFLTVENYYVLARGESREI